MRDAQSDSPAGNQGQWENCDGISAYDSLSRARWAWNVGRKLGAKGALKPQQVWGSALIASNGYVTGALFDLAIGSKLRGCDLVKVRIGDLRSAGQIRKRATVLQQRTGRPVQFELLEPARTSNLAWLERRACTVDAYAFPSRTDDTKHLSTCQYARLVDEWVTGIGLRRKDYGTYRSGGRKCRSSIVRPAICARSRYCSVTRSLRQTFDARSVKQGRAMTIFAPAARKADRRLGCCGRRQISPPRGAGPIGTARGGPRSERSSRPVSQET